MANEFVVKHGLIVVSGTITGDGSNLTGVGGGGAGFKVLRIPN